MIQMQTTLDALVSQFGEVKRAVTEAGLNFKIPLIQTVRYFDNRILTLTFFSTQ